MAGGKWWGHKAGRWGSGGIVQNRGSGARWQGKGAVRKGRQGVARGCGEGVWGGGRQEGGICLG